MGCLGSCCSCIGNTIYYIVNLILLLIGIAFLCIGTITMVSWQCTIEKLLHEFYLAIGFPATSVTVSDAVDFNVSTYGIILLSVGAFLVILSLFAFMGLAPSLRFLQKISVIIFIIVSLILLGASIFVLVFVCLQTKPDYLDFVGETMKLAMKQYKPTTGQSGKDDFSVEGAVIDMVQSAFHCCGVNGINDYGKGGVADLTKRKWNMELWGGSKSQDIKIPPTCCRTEDEKKKWPLGDTMDDHLDIDIKNFPSPKNILAPACFTEESMLKDSKNVHTVRKCPDAVYHVMQSVQTEIIIACSVLIAVFVLIIIALFVKLCSRTKKSTKGNDAELQVRPPAAAAAQQAQQQPLPAVSAQVPAYPGYPPPPMTAGYPAYPAPVGYPGYPSPYPYQPALGKQK